MPFWPCEVAKFRVFPLLFALSNFVAPIRPQATCAFVSANFVQFVVDDTPTEPKIADDLLICRHLRGPSVSCCTRRMEAKFEQFAREQLDSVVQGEFELVREFFDNWASTFRAEFSLALNRTERTLRHIFHRTYGHFFTQNIEMFNTFFSHMNSLLSASPASSTFDDALLQLLQRIFLAEFALLNPLRASDLLAHEQCMRHLFPAFAPFGSIPSAIAALHGRTFVAWTSLIDALDSVGELMYSLGRDFSLTSRCTDSVVRMRFCPICFGRHSPKVRPCPVYCQYVIRRCFHELTAAIDLQWDGLIDSMVRLSASLISVHNPHISLAPLPFQLSEAIMHFQENAQLLSGRILFRCFGDDLQKIVTERGENGRTKRDLSMTESEDYDNEEEAEEEAEEDEEEADEAVEDEFLQATAASSAFSSARSLRRSIERFTDKLLRMKGFWRGLGRMLCQEGGIQADVRGSDESCWNANGRESWWDGKGGEGAETARGKATDQPTAGNFADKFAQERTAMEAMAKRLQFANGKRTEIGEKNTNRMENVTSVEDNRHPFEEPVNAIDVDDYKPDDYQSYESVGKWWHWSDVEKRPEGKTNGGDDGSSRIAISQATAILSLLTLFL
uniref:Glypican n=1 Tax=Globodera rostochiensis TaxID=31243 RepID=A0A914H044_GLORO